MNENLTKIRSLIRRMVENRYANETSEMSSEIYFVLHKKKLFAQITPATLVVFLYPPRIHSLLSIQYLPENENMSHE